MPPQRPDPSLGVFETLLVRDGRVQAPEAHVERLARSVRELYQLGLGADLAASIVERARPLTGGHRLRVDAIPDGGELRVEFQIASVQPGDPAPVVLTPVEVSGGLGSHKWRDRRLLDSLAGPGRVPLLIDDDGDVLEAAWANVWLLEEGSLITPPTDGRLLPGVTRSLLLELAPRHGLQTRVEPVSIARARSATAIFVTSAVRLAVAATLHPAPTSSGEPAAVARVQGLLGAGAWA